MKIIATPTKDTVNAGFAFDLAEAIRWTPDAIFCIAQGAILPNLRNMLAKKALETKATHIIFIDSDMRFAPDTIHKLVKRNKDIIASNCKKRTQDEWTARKDGKPVSSEFKKGIEEVDTIGMGVTCIKTSVFEKMAEPYFSTPWDTQEKKHVGEDVFFCHMAREAGFKIFIDHEVSGKVKHAGLVEFGI